MTLAQFKESIEANSLPPGINDLLLSLWYDARGDWYKSHDVISEIETSGAAHIHAYLHRKEGDLFNADYWYRRAGETRPSYSLEEEWERLVNKFIA